MSPAAIILRGLLVFVQLGNSTAIITAPSGILAFFIFNDALCPFAAKSAVRQHDYVGWKGLQYCVH